MEYVSPAEFWSRTAGIVFLFGIVPSIVIACVNRYTAYDLSWLHRYIWLLVGSFWFVLFWQHFANPISAQMPG